MKLVNRADWMKSRRRRAVFGLPQIAVVSAALCGLAGAQQTGPPAGTPLPSAPTPAVPPMQVVAPGTAPNTSATGLGIVAAVQRALDQNPALHLQRNAVDYYRGALDVQKGIFDTTLNANTTGGRSYTPLPRSAIDTASQAGINTRAQAVDSTSTAIGVSKLFRNGISLSPTLNLARSSDNLTNKVGTTTSSGGVQLNLPLLRNRGRDTVDAQERAAQRELEAQGLDLAQTASSTIAQTVTAYWNYLGSLQALDAYRQSELRGQALLDNTRAMITADALPRAEINFATANLATRTSNRSAAEQSVVSAAQALATAIGVPPDQILSIAAPADPLPQLTNDADLPVRPDSLLGYVGAALQHRADYQSALTRVGEAEILRIGAKGQMRPQLDATLNAGYAGLQENGRFDKYFGSIFQNTVGPNISGGVNFNFPIGNHYYRGLFEQADAATRQSQDRVVLVGNSIATSVVAAANGLNTSALQLRTAHQAAESYRLALQGERERLRFGQSSLLDILQSEDRYISAELNEIGAQVAYANAIAGFRFSTGTYLNLNQPLQNVSPDAFYRAQSIAVAPGTTPPPGIVP